MLGTSPPNFYFIPTPMAVPNDPRNIVQSTEDFLELVLVAHIMLAAEKEYSDGLTLEEVADKIVTKYVQLEPLPAGKCH